MRTGKICPNCQEVVKRDVGYKHKEGKCIISPTRTDVGVEMSVNVWAAFLSLVKDAHLLKERANKLGISWQDLQDV